VPPTIPASAAKALAVVGEGVSRVIRRPPLLARGQLTFLLWEARADSSKAQQELGFKPRPWREGIPQLVQWMIDGDRV
jgi:nucleoside-diphosphate-sugar epimerase